MAMQVKFHLVKNVLPVPLGDKMSLKNLICSVLAQLLEEYNLRFEEASFAGLDGKTGEEIETVIYIGRTTKLRFIRSDGEVNAEILNRSGQWIYVRCFGAETLSEPSIEELLETIPDHPLSDVENLKELNEHIRHALDHFG